jgi:hypothetical protein
MASRAELMGGVTYAFMRMSSETMIPKLQGGGPPGNVNFVNYVRDVVQLQRVPPSPLPPQTWLAAWHCCCGHWIVKCVLLFHSIDRAIRTDDQPPQSGVAQTQKRHWQLRTLKVFDTRLQCKPPPRQRLRQQPRPAESLFLARLQVDEGSHPSIECLRVNFFPGIRADF